MRTLHHIQLSFLLFCGLILSAQGSTGPFNPDEIHREMGYLAMEDGTRLAYVFHLPKKGGRYPVLFQYNAYDASGADARDSREMMEYLENGYALLTANSRGTGCSEGKFEFASPREAREGARFIEWAGVQPWSTGKVGMFGNSYSGITQIMVASQRPKHLAAISPGAAAGEAYRDCFFPGGIFNYSFITQWTIYGQPYIARRGASARIRSGDQDCVKTLEEQVTGATYHIVKERTLYDDWWKDRAFEEQAQSIEVPTLIFHAWQDQQVAVRGGTRLFEQITAPKKIVLSNGGHGLYSRPASRALRMRWYDRWMKGTENGIEQEPPVTVWFDTHRKDGGWEKGWSLEFQQWPPEESEHRKFWLTADGRLSETGLDSDKSRGTRQYAYPVGTEFVGSNLMFKLPPLPWASLAYRTEPVKSDLTILGSPLLTLYLSCEATDTDFMVVLHDVAPSGKTMYLQKGLLRASQRSIDPSKSTHEALPDFDVKRLRPGEITEFKLSILPVGHVVRTGHQLELVVMAPSPIPQPNWGLLPVMLPSLNKAYHSEQYPTSLRLPILPGANAQAAAPDCATLEFQPCRDPLPYDLLNGFADP